MMNNLEKLLRNAGGKAEMKCLKCGAELPDDARFCPYCGGKIEINISPSGEEETVVSPSIQIDSVKKEEKKREVFKKLTDMLKDKLVEQWSKLSLYGKFITVTLVGFTLLFFVAFLFGKTAAGAIAVLQIVLTVAAVLMKKQIIKPYKKGMHIISLILAAILLIPYVSFFKVDYSDGKKIEWTDILLGDVVPKPDSLFGEIISNREDCLALYVYKTSFADYNQYITDCMEKGFVVEVNQIGQLYNAYNADGYKLSLHYDEYGEKMYINIDGTAEYGMLVWPDSLIANMLPVPESTTGEITQDDETGFCAQVSNMSVEKFQSYTAACAENGFDIDVSNSAKSYFAENSEGYKLSVDYQNNNVITISVDEPEYDVSLEVKSVENLIFSRYDIEVYVDDTLKGTINHGTTKTFDLTMTKGTYEVKFVSAENDEITGTVTIDVQKNETLQYKITCTSSKIDVKTIVENDSKNEDNNVESEEVLSNATEQNNHSEKTETSNITVTMGEEDFIGMLYTDAEAKFREMGFTVFEYKTLETEDINKPDDTIGAVEIKKWKFAKGDFKIGDTYEPDAVVVLWYYVCNEPEPNLTVENCPELAAMLSNKAELDDSYSIFATNYKGKCIEFDGRIDYCTKHENYNTRFDYLVSAGDYDPDHQVGPSFKFENVAYYDLNTDLDTVSVGLNVHIIAKVVSYDNDSGLFYLDPISVTKR